MDISFRCNRVPGTTANSDLPIKKPEVRLFRITQHFKDFKMLKDFQHFKALSFSHLLSMMSLTGEVVSTDCLIGGEFFWICLSSLTPQQIRVTWRDTALVSENIVKVTFLNYWLIVKVSKKNVLLDTGYCVFLAINMFIQSKYSMSVFGKVELPLESSAL